MKRPSPYPLSGCLLLLSTAACQIDWTPPPASSGTGSLAAARPAPPTAPRPNVVLIVADDLGWGDLGCYGQPRIDTPELDRMAREGLRFHQFYAGATVCAPSRSALMTGQHTGHTRIRGNRVQDLLPEDVTVAEVLRDAGYRTGCFGKWGLGTVDGSGSPVRQGYERFFGYLDQRHAHNYYPSFLIDLEGPGDTSPRIALDNVVPDERKSGAGVATEKRDYSHDRIVDEALAWLGQQEQDTPFFLTLTVTLPHANNEAGAAGMEVPELGRYASEDWPEPAKGFAAMVTRLDRDVGRVRRALEEARLDRDTLVLFTSDNGPHSEGGHRSWFFSSSGPLQGEKRHLTEGGIRVPTIAWWPGRIAPGQETETVGAFWDLLPTFAELAGATAHVPSDVDGRSLVPTLLGDRPQGPTPDLYWSFYERGGARALLHEGRWKLIQQPLDTAPRLYDLSQDLGEERDLADSSIELVALLTSRMDAADVPNELWTLPLPRKETAGSE